MRKINSYCLVCKKNRLNVKFTGKYKNILAYNLKCKRDTESVDSEVLKTKNDRLMLLSKCTVCGIRGQEAKGLLSSLGIERPLKKIPLFQVTFCCNSVEYKMNEIIARFLLVKFIPEMHLKQPRFTYIACGPFTKAKKEFKNLCRQKTQIISTKMILINLVFNIMWLMVNKKIGINEYNQTKF